MNKRIESMQLGVDVIKKLERRIENLSSALKVIQTWATFRGGEMLIPEHVEKLCKQVLKEPKR